MTDEPTTDSRPLEERLREYRDSLVGVATQLDDTATAILEARAGYLAPEEVSPLVEGARLFRTVAEDVTKVLDGEELGRFEVTGTVAEHPPEEDPFDDLVSGLRSSTVTIVLWSGTLDAKLAFEVGVAATSEVPILLHDLDGTAPEKLRRIADAYVVGATDDPQTGERLTAALLGLAPDLDGAPE